MAIFHMTIKIVGRSKGKSVISASAYLNGDVMKNEETGRASYYTSKNEVVYTQLMMCPNAPPEWANVPEENVVRFMKSTRYGRATDKKAVIDKFKLTFQKQKLWNEVLKVEKESNAQIARAFEFSLPKEWSRQEQIAYATDFIQRNFVDKGMCADWSIHDKGDGNPHVHLLLTMRPFNKDHSWGNKEVKDWDFERDSSGQIIINPCHHNWWQDKNIPDRCGIRIPILDAKGNQKVGARNRKQWKRVLTDSTGWNNPKNCELWRGEWAKECNLHLPKDKWIDHRSFERQGKFEIPTIHEGTSARMIEQKFQEGNGNIPSWKVEINQTIKQQNAILKKLGKAFANIAELLQQWKEILYDLRRKPRSASNIGRNDIPVRGTTGIDGRDVSGSGKQQPAVGENAGAQSRIRAIKQRITDTAGNIAKYRRDVTSSGNTGQKNSGTGSRESAMERISAEAKQREYNFTTTERGIVEIKQRIRKVREMDERINQLKARRTDAGTTGIIGGDAGGTRSEGKNNGRARESAKRIADINREAQQREQNREYTSIKERLETNKRLAKERESRSKYPDKGTSR